MGDHALLSASSSHKWLNCTPSVRLEETMENKTSGYMEEGTLAHFFAELKLRGYFTQMTKKKLNIELKKLQESGFYNQEMLAHTDTYLEYIKQIALLNATQPFVGIEKRVDYSDFAKEGFGTTDCLLISRDTLYIIDFKYGKGVAVSVEENPQMKLYALGALQEYGFLYPIDKVKLCIVQPRLDNISEYEISVTDLTKWGEEIKPIAEKAYLGIGEFNPGEHCRFCKAKGCCKARATTNMTNLTRAKNANILDSKELGSILTLTDGIEKWVKEVREHALSEVLKGENIPGWKAVEGKSNRAINNIDEAFEKLKENGIEEVLLYERKPIGITAMESLVGKKKFTELLDGYIVKPKGSPTLVVESDQREVYKKSSAAEEFAEKEGGI